LARFGSIARFQKDFIMGWQDRPYSSKPQKSGFDFKNVLFGSLSLGEWFGIHVRVHASLLLLLVSTCFLRARAAAWAFAMR